MDWSDEARARLEEEEKRLRLKAANLQERHGAWSLMAKQELVVAADIRAALEEIEDSQSQHEATCRTMQGEIDRQVKRAEAAEAEVGQMEIDARADRDEIRRLKSKLAEAERERDVWREKERHKYEVARKAETEVERLKTDVLYEQERNHNNVAQYTAEVVRLREALSALLDLEELDLKHAYTTCDVGDSMNADRGCVWCVARAALRGER